MELRKVNNTIKNENIEKVISVLDELKSDKPKQKNIHKNHRQRLKSQFLSNGISALTDIQKLELLLFYAIPQKDTNPIAHELIDNFGSLKNVLKADYKSLIKVSGVKENTALFLTLINDILNFSNSPDTDEYINGTRDAINYISKFFFNVNVEQFYVICLSKSNKVLNTTMLKSGSSDEVSVQIRNITWLAIENKCNRIIIAHNHPNGKAIMSDEDCSFTYSLICSCILNSIDILDHIIIGTDKGISLGAQGVLQKLKKKAVSTIQIPKDKKAFLSASSEAYKIDQE